MGWVSGRLSPPGDAQVHQQGGPRQRGSAAPRVARASRPVRCARDACQSHNADTQQQRQQTGPSRWRGCRHAQRPRFTGIRRRRGMRKRAPRPRDHGTGGPIGSGHRSGHSRRMGHRRRRCFRAAGTSLGGQTVHEKQPGKHRTHGDQAGGGPRRECAATHRVSRRCCTGPVRPIVLTRAPYPGDRRERGKGWPARRISFRIRHTFDSDHMKLASVSWPRPPRATAANVMRDAVTTTILWTTFTPIHTPLGYLGR